MRISDWSSDVCSSDLFHERDSMEPVSFADLIERAESGLVTVLDVRPEDEFAHSHLPGALNILLSQIGRASCRERVCQCVEISVVAVSLKTKETIYVRKG